MKGPIWISVPLVVTPAEDGNYHVVDGHTRFAVAKEAGLDEVPCIVEELREPGSGPLTDPPFRKGAGHNFNISTSRRFNDEA